MSITPPEGQHFEDPAAELAHLRSLVAQMHANQLSETELDELRQLRAERSERLERERLERLEAEKRLSPPSHHVHLADGQIIPGSQHGTHHTTGDGTGHPKGDTIVRVAAAYAMD